VPAYLARTGYESNPIWTGPAAAAMLPRASSVTHVPGTYLARTGYSAQVAGWLLKGAVAYAATKALGEATVRYCEVRTVTM